MLLGCLVFSSMRLGVPFIAPRQLGAVESKSGRPILPSVVGCTGQSGAHRTLFQLRDLPCLTDMALLDLVGMRNQNVLSTDNHTRREARSEGDLMSVFAETEMLRTVLQR